MVRFSYTLFIALFLWVGSYGQSPKDLVARLQQVKQLESTRDDVRRILADFNTDETDEHVQRYYNDELEITVSYADGRCVDDPHEEEFTSLWKIDEWVVTRIEVEWEDDIKDAGFDLSRLIKEQTYFGSPERQTYHDKSRGLAIKTYENSLQTLILFPPKELSRKLCEESVTAKAFYSRKSWFAKPLKDRSVCNWVNGFANVEDIVLSATEAEASTGKTISVTTVARDPENDVLTYNYVVSGGRIVGTGAKVVWDLSNARPGTYTILAGADDGAGVVGKTVTKTVTVK